MIRSVPILLALASITLAEPKFEVVAKLDQAPGNPAVAEDGRIILSQHPFGAPGVRVVEVTPSAFHVHASTGMTSEPPRPDDAKTNPFPDAAWSGPVDGSGVGIGSIIGLRVAYTPGRAPPDGSQRMGLDTGLVGAGFVSKGTLWLLDAGGERTPPKLVCVTWQGDAPRVSRVIHLPAPSSTPTSFAQDLAIDTKRNKIYLADCGLGDPKKPNPAFIVVDLETGASRRVLEGDAKLMPEPDAKMVIDGTEVRSPDGTAPRVGLNPITIDAANEWVYFGAMHGTKVYRIKAEDLAKEGVGDAELSKRIEVYGPKPVSDGISIDSAGNVYVTDVAQNGIGVTKADGTYQLLFSDPQIGWPDGICAASDGYMYVTVNQLHRHPPLNGGKNAVKPPFLLIRFKPLAAVVPGR